VLTKELGDYTPIAQHFEQNNRKYFTFYPKSEKGLKLVIRHLPSGTRAEDISNDLQSQGFTVINVKQMKITHCTPEGGSQVMNLPLFLITLSRN
jgi:hypothetical protein